MRKKFNTLTENWSPERRKKVAAEVARRQAEMALDELRTARELTQASLAEIMGTTQAAVSKLERRTDMYVSSLRAIIRAIGGYLRIEAVFPEGAVEIKQFGPTMKTGGGG